MDGARRPTVYYLLFALSGFTGLIYESTWSQYLRLLVGHAALAQDRVARVLKDYDIPANSDYFPVLDQHAAKARYLRDIAAGLIDRAREGE